MEGKRPGREKEEERKKKEEGGLVFCKYDGSSSMGCCGVPGGRGRA
jgi:hypothetical protein